MNRLDFKTYMHLHVILLLYSLVSIVSKTASSAKLMSFKFLFLYILILAILFIYAFYWQRILRKISLNSAIANKSIVVIWGLAWGKLLYNEKIAMNNILGAILIIIGLFIVVTTNE